MIYKSPAPTLKHDIFASTPFSKYIKLVKGPTNKKKKKKKPTYRPSFFWPCYPKHRFFFLGLRGLFTE